MHALFTIFLAPALAILLCLAACAKESPARAEQQNALSQAIAHPHDSQAFTQGLVYENGVLYEGTGLYGKSELRRVDLETGKVLKRRKLAPQYFGEGITLFQNRIYQLTWKSKIVFVYDADSFSLLARHDYDTEGWGITHDGKQLIMSDGTSYIYFRDPQTFEETGRIQVSDKGRPVEELNELEFVAGEILANVWYSDKIARIDPATGNIIDWLDLSRLLPPSEKRRLPKTSVLNGIAYDAEGQRLFVTGKNWPKLYELSWPPSTNPTGNDSP